MSAPLHVAFIWHQHQPLYKSTAVSTEAAAQYRLPWVRLHGAKDYLDLILILERYPRLHQTVNLVPSLILQLEDYISGIAIDPYMTATLTPEAQLTREQKHFIISSFFDANHRTLIDPHPRYAELYDQRHEKGYAWCLTNWTAPDYSDLLAWHNLAWIDPLFWDDPEIARWLEQGRDFSLSDRQRIISKQRQIIKRIIPQHKKMQEAGQLEIITSPYTHPILPLLADSEAARVAVPKITLPRRRFQWPEDMERHLRKGWEIYNDRFGRPPAGLWPSEESVSPAILPYVARQGFKWLCSDEGVLGHSLKHFFHRDENGTVTEPELLYRPYRLRTDDGDLAIVFRDHRLSDLIGFTYSGMNPITAADDLIHHLNNIAVSLPADMDTPALVTIALDGENCWESYERDGLPFLEALYRRLNDHRGIELVTVREYLEKYPPVVDIAPGDLHSGSWIDANFTTWIGDKVKNKAWDYLAAARDVLAAHPEATEENNPEAWEALYAAEGSDWFWWFGEGHSSNHDAIFDRLFREHLVALYKALNETVPGYLAQPLEDHQRRPTHLPSGFIHPIIDGFPDEQDWDKAGRIEIGGAGGTMHQGTIVQRLFYGWDHVGFYLRVDYKAGAEPGRDIPPGLHLVWYFDNVHRLQSPVPLKGVPGRPPLNYGYHYHVAIDLRAETVCFQQAGEYHGWETRPTGAKVSFNQCLELVIPWEDMHIEPDCNLHLLAVMAEGEDFKDFLPQGGLVQLTRP